jgi:hypothetical protein
MQEEQIATQGIANIMLESAYGQRMIIHKPWSQDVGVILALSGVAIMV